VVYILSLANYKYDTQDGFPLFAVLNPLICKYDYKWDSFSYTYHPVNKETKVVLSWISPDFVQLPYLTVQVN
jgi:hypothetical protein